MIQIKTEVIHLSTNAVWSYTYIGEDLDWTIPSEWLFSFQNATDPGLLAESWHFERAYEVEIY